MDEEGHSGSVWHHRIPVIDNTRKMWPSFQKRVTSITKAQQSFISIHGESPCNLAPAHFTVHVVQVRLNFALGFAHEANPLFETGFSPGCPSSVLISLPARLARRGRGRQEINPDLLLLWLSSLQEIPSEAFSILHGFWKKFLRKHWLNRCQLVSSSLRIKGKKKRIHCFSRPCHT